MQWRGYNNKGLHGRFSTSPVSGGLPLATMSGNGYAVLANLALPSHKHPPWNLPQPLQCHYVRVDKINRINDSECLPVPVQFDGDRIEGDLP